ncbi:TPA: hypothetical protein HA251_05185 [Candidatus Woesearchaeota archaeon]|nr:hypothetical protein [Candidatus Woesearchaeota archaeon]
MQNNRLRNTVLSAALAGSMLAPQAANADGVVDAAKNFWSYVTGKAKSVATEQVKAPAPRVTPRPSPRPVPTPVPAHKVSAPATAPRAAPQSAATSAPAASQATPATLEQKITIRELGNTPCPDGSAQPCIQRTYGINSPKPGVNETYVTKHNALGIELERTILKHTYTPVKNGKIPFADRFVRNDTLGTYVTVLCQGEYLKVHTPKGPDNESYIIDKRTRNTVDEVAIGKDFTITHKEIVDKNLDAVDLLYDVVLNKGKDNCSSSKVEIVVFAKDNCATSAGERIPSPDTPFKGILSDDEVTVDGKKAKKGKKPQAPPAPYWEVTGMIGGGMDNFTGTQQVQTANGVVKRDVDPQSYNLGQVKMQVQRYSPRTHFFLNGALTSGSDEGNPTGNYGGLCTQKIGASAFSLGLDLTTGPVLGPFGIGAGGRFEQKTITTSNGWEGETSRQNNQEYGARGFLSAGRMDKDYAIAGVEYWIQPIVEKYQAGDGKPYTASASTEGMLTYFAESRVRFGKDDRGVLDLSARFAPNVKTIYTSDKDTLTSTSDMWNARLGLGWMFSDHWGVYGQAALAHNEETMERPNPKDLSKQLLDNYKHDGQTVGLGVIWRPGK